MKILHLTKISTGGAFIAANRISDSLNQIGHESRVEVIDDKSTGRLNLPRIQAKLDFLNESISSSSMTTSILRSYSVSGSVFEKLRNVDVVNLHWIPGLLHKDFINQLREVRRVVWTMHDMNVFTGICHHSSGCRNFEKNCMLCPQFVIPRIPVAARVLKEKRVYLEKLKQSSFIAPSEWLRKEALASSILKGQLVDVIPNPIPNALIEHEKKSDLSKSLNLRSGTLIVGILGANYGVQKGGKNALEEITKFCNRTGIKIQVLVFGEKYSDVNGLDSVSTLDHIDVNFEDALQACDLYVHMSEYENLPNVIIEAQSLGVPVIALDRGGVSETISVGVTGYLMKENNEFYNAMCWFLDASKDSKIRSNSKIFAQSKFDQTKIAKLYTEVYSR